MPEPNLSEASDRVRAVVDFMDRHGVWRLLSRNSPATSCRDAAARRMRLGIQGIPLYDEMLSLCVVAYRPEGRRYALLHCRANARFDLEAASNALGTTRAIARLSPEELESEFGSMYGTVNPFLDSDRFIHVFDEDVCSAYTFPQTMMTNAGEPTWAVEFRPRELIDALSRETLTFTANITEATMPKVRLPSFGIITGNGPESGMALWQHLNDAVYAGLTQSQSVRGDLTYPKVVLHSLPEMGLSMELRERSEDVWAAISSALEHLCHSGVDHVALACNTTHYFRDRIESALAKHGVTFVSMVDAVLKSIDQRGVRDLTIIGIPVVADLGDMSSYRELRKMNVRPVHAEAEEHLQELGYIIKSLESGKKDAKALNKLRHIMDIGVATSNVLIALTEISVLLQRFPKLRERIAGKSIIDPLRIYGEELARLYLRAMPSEEQAG